VSAVSICVPQLGESVREARIVALLKAEGDSVGRDEPLIEVETDKALYVVESPADGTVGTWLFAEGAVLPVGTVLGEVRTVEGPPRLLRNGGVSPRLRERGRVLGIPRRELERMAEERARALTDSDLDEVASAFGAGRTWKAAPSSAVPATLASSFRREALDLIRRRRRSDAGQPVPSAVELIAWQVLCALERHPRMRVLIDENRSILAQQHSSVGVAVELPDDELAVAAVRNSGELDENGFLAEMRCSIASVRRGRRPTAAPQVIVSSLAHLGVETAIPIVVPPSIGTLFVGVPLLAADTRFFGKRSQIALTFDHRAINGAAAARFLRDVVAGIESCCRGV
jgi:pyruvate/2-oxoglutarate dehydrogenase complex dihydrolipoamide acyltransferase (E2) component